MQFQSIASQVFFQAVIALITFSCLAFGQLHCVDDYAKLSSTTEERARIASSPAKYVARWEERRDGKGVLGWVSRKWWDLLTVPNHYAARWLRRSDEESLWLYTASNKLDPDTTTDIIDAVRRSAIDPDTGTRDFQRASELADQNGRSHIERPIDAANRWIDQLKDHKETVSTMTLEGHAALFNERQLSRAWSETKGDNKAVIELARVDNGKLVFYIPEAMDRDEVRVRYNQAFNKMLRTVGNYSWFPKWVSRWAFSKEAAAEGATEDGVFFWKKGLMNQELQLALHFEKVRMLHRELDNHRLTREALADRLVQISHDYPDYQAATTAEEIANAQERATELLSILSSPVVAPLLRNSNHEDLGKIHQDFINGLLSPEQFLSALNEQHATQFAALARDIRPLPKEINDLLLRADAALDHGTFQPTSRALYKLKTAERKAQIRGWRTRPELNERTLKDQILTSALGNTRRIPNYSSPAHTVARSLFSPWAMSIIGAGAFGVALYEWSFSHKMEDSETAKEICAGMDSHQLFLSCVEVRLESEFGYPISVSIDPKSFLFSSKANNDSKVDEDVIRQRIEGYIRARKAHLK